MNTKIAVLGANGVYARHLLPRLAAAGHDVRAIVRRPEAAGVARACGCEVATADIFDTGSLVAALEGCETGINLATSLPGPSGRGDFAANDVLRAQGTSNWVAACRKAGVQRIIQQSIGWVSASGSSQWSDETHVYPGSEDTIAVKAIRACMTMEDTIRESGLDWMVLRGGLFYGPGTGFDDRWHGQAAAGKLRLPGDGQDFVSLVHIADMAAATAVVLKKWASRETFIICDDEPCTWRDLFGFICAISGQGEPEPGGRIDFPSSRLRNVKFREATGWQPFYTGYRLGMIR